MLAYALAMADEPNPAAPKHTNRLAKEKSPYLLQHAHNPVDWHPWGEEAFARAKRENKPVLLSIGYATCHWCHVMERESFENEEIAKFLNEHFIAIKLDREERPDLDKIYMSAMQALELGGGWPLNVFLTPEQKPFYGGTYFPPKPARGLPSFLDVLERVAGIWGEREGEIRSNADHLTSEMHRVLASATLAPDATLPGAAPLAAAALEYLGEYDQAHGGFGSAPKFPQPSVITAVLRHGAENNDARALKAALRTLRRMAAGGIHDQIGGGFARYAVDAAWLVPHFEKMLYDNAQLAVAYLDASLVADEPEKTILTDAARGIFAYVLRDMASADGAFYSAEDADSEGHEGKFYTWTKTEIGQLLPPDEAALALSYWGVTEQGNFLDHSHPDPLPGQNILHIAQPESGLAPEEKTRLESARRTLFEARASRIRPLRDDKVLANWNGLMLSACARGGMILQDEALISAAVKNARFLRKNLWSEEGRAMAHRWREGEVERTPLLNSHAYVLQGVIDLYQATLDPQWLEWAGALADASVRLFYDAEHGGFFQGGAETGALLRLKETYDDAEPSGNSVMVGALLQLAALTEEPRWREIAEKTLRFFGPKLRNVPGSLPLMAQAAANAASEPFRVIIAGDPASPEALALRHAAWATHAPNRVILGTAGPVEPFARTLEAKDGRATAYVCSGTFCNLPTHDAAEVHQHLQKKPARASEPQPEADPPAPPLAQ